MTLPPIPPSWSSLAVTILALVLYGMIFCMAVMADLSERHFMLVNGSLGGLGPVVFIAIRHHVDSRHSQNGNGSEEKPESRKSE